ncbi:MAG TPA: Rieske (2Fe-2S) protein, partial [Pyrinomonadaceae bacterium]|nr:Rieske (2Fe-2S) protein [Pyrinomonadaceae bacterium]
MASTLKEILESYHAHAPLSEAWTIPDTWYVDSRVAELERRTVFAKSWQLIGRADQVREPGQYITWELAGEPLVVVRGSDKVLRGFFNVCRHHAAAVITEPEGKANVLRCPYHGWTYSLAGELKGTPDFTGVCNFDRAANGLVPVETAVWENWVFVKLEPTALSLEDFLGADLLNQTQSLNFGSLHWMERRHYAFDCNW